jgi:hypothetical protein
MSTGALECWSEVKHNLANAHGAQQPHLCGACLVDTDVQQCCGGDHNEKFPFHCQPPDHRDFPASGVLANHVSYRRPSG